MTNDGIERELQALWRRLTPPPKTDPAYKQVTAKMWWKLQHLEHVPPEEREDVVIAFAAARWPARSLQPKSSRPRMLPCGTLPIPPHWPNPWGSPSWKKPTTASAADSATRRRFATDLLNLTLAGPRVNRYQKVDHDAAEWLPSQNRCWFAARVLSVRQRYGLTIDRREADALDQVLAGCESTALITFARGVVPVAAAAAPGSPEAIAAWDDNGNGRVSCAEAHAHGIAPVTRGHPAYPFMRDGDGDGVVCETGGRASPTASPSRPADAQGAWRRRAIQRIARRGSRPASRRWFMRCSCAPRRILLRFRPTAHVRCLRQRRCPTAAQPAQTRPGRQQLGAPSAALRTPRGGCRPNLWPPRPSRLRRCHVLFHGRQAGVCSNPTSGYAPASRSSSAQLGTLRQCR